LAWEATNEDINGAWLECRDIIPATDAGPMSLEDASAILIYLYLPFDLVTRGCHLEAKLETTDPRKQTPDRDGPAM
jgi:hypothetical protein